METKVEVYWEGRPDVHELWQQEKIDRSLDSRVQTGSGGCYSFLRIGKDENTIGKAISLALETLFWLKSECGIKAGHVLVDGVALGTFVTNLNYVATETQATMQEAVSELKASRSVVRNKAIADIRGKLEMATFRLGRWIKK